jgi:hypothetical protein
VFWFKLPFALFDLGAIAAIWWLLRVHDVPGERVLIYCWSPLPIVEFWGMGHNDSLVILLVALALVAAARERWTWAFAALALAIGAKIWPILLLPIFVGWKRNRPARAWQWWPVVPILVLITLPYWSNVSENFRFASGFIGGWRNNDSLFGIILKLAREDLYRAKHIAFGIVAGVVMIVTFVRLPIERAALAAIATMLMVASNCHPWYLTWILPLLAVRPVPALLLWTVLTPIAYAAVISWVTLGEWQGSSALRWYEYAPVYAMLIGCWLATWLAAGRRPLRNSARIPE